MVHDNGPFAIWGSALAEDHRGHWYPSTALDDLLHIAKGKINDTRLYRCLDRLLPCKTKLEQHPGCVLQVANWPSDCAQLVLALIVNQDGFPFSYELFDGNRADVSTV